VRVVIDATSVGSGLGGDETMICGVLRGLAAVARPSDAIVVLAAEPDLLPVEIHSHPDATVVAMRRRGGPVHFGRDLGRVLGSLDPVPDAVFSVTHAPLRTSIPVALMVQDLSFHHRPDFYPPLERARLRALVPRQMRSARAVLTVSDHARDDLVRSFDLDGSRVFTVPNSIAPAARVVGDALDRGRARLAEQGVRGPFLLYLGNLHPRKNVARAIRAFTEAVRSEPALASYQFVIAGARWFSGDDEERAAADAPPGSILFLGRVDDDQRDLLLQEAEALVYVSIFEGFGLPPLEAMARGTAVVAADSTSIPEVCGEAAVLVDPLDTHAIADGLRRVLVDGDLRRRLVEAGAQRVAHYSAERTGRAALDAFDSMSPTEVPAR
jgi:glycosyltransferase involved in cell wall biosynthesis